MNCPKKWTFIPVILFFAFVLVFSAGAEGSQEKTGGTGDESIDISVLSYATAASPEYPIVQSVFAQFEEDYPNVTINHEGLESAACRDKLAIEMASGNPPDVSYMVTGLGREYGSEGLLLDLKPFLDKNPEWKNIYYDSALNMFQDVMDGHIFLIPATAQYGGIFYNKTVMGDVGYDKPAQTWDDMISQIKKIRSGGYHPFLTGGKEYRWAWLISQVMVRTCGVDTMNALYFGEEKTAWDDPDNGFIAALARFEEMVQAKAFPENVNGLPRDVANLMMGDDEGAMWYEGAWLVGTWGNAVGWDFVNNRVGFTTFPKIAGAKGDQVGGVGGSLLGWGVSSKIAGKEQEMCVELVRRLEGREVATKKLVENSRVSATKPLGGAMDEIVPLTREIIETYQDIPKVAMPTDVAPVPPVDNAVKKIACPAIVDGTMTPKEAAIEVNKRAVEYFSTE